MSELTVETAKELVAKVREALNNIEYDEFSYGLYFTKGDTRLEVEGDLPIDRGIIWVDGYESLKWDNSNTGN